MSSISDNWIADAAGTGRSLAALPYGLTARRPICLATRGVITGSAIFTTLVAEENDGSGPGVIFTNTNADCSTGGLIAAVVGNGTAVGKFVSKSIFRAASPLN